MPAAFSIFEFPLRVSTQMNLGICHWSTSKSEKTSFLRLLANLATRRGGGQLAQVCSRITLRELKALRVNHILDIAPWRSAPGLEKLALKAKAT